MTESHFVKSIAGGKVKQNGQGTSDKQWKEKPRFLLAASTMDFTRLFVIDYIGKGVRYNILDIFHRGESCELKVWSIEYFHILLRDDQERLLLAAGFKRVDFYGNYDFDLYDKEQSNRIITVAHK